jgi:hypothetical protein
MAGDGPASASADYRAAQRLWVAAVDLAVGPMRAQPARPARRAASNVSSSTGLSAKPHLVALVRAGARFEKGKLVERPDKSRDDQQVALHADSDRQIGRSAPGAATPGIDFRRPNLLVLIQNLVPVVSSNPIDVPQNSIRRGAGDNSSCARA